MTQGWIKIRIVRRKAKFQIGKAQQRENWSSSFQCWINDKEFEEIFKITSVSLEDKKSFLSMNIGRPKNSITLSNSQINMPCRTTPL